MKINLRYHHQHKGYTCGPACLRMVFEHLGKKYSEEKLTRACRTNKEFGTNHEHLLSEIEKEKFIQYSKNNGKLKDLINFVETGNLAIINYLDPFCSQSHYAIVTGYTDDKKSIILADPCNGNDFTLSWKDLKKRWHNQNNTSKGWYVIIGREAVNI